MVGGGTAGIVGAMTAASLGAQVLMVERDQPGGDCLWTGCVPSKALLAAAAVAASARDADRFGVRVGEVRVDFAAVRAHVRAAIDVIAPVDSVKALTKAGVEVVTGEALFTGPDTIEVADREIGFRQALLATGASPAIPDIDGLADASFVTSDSVWDLDELPAGLVVLGGGPLGCELGQAFARLGSQVTIIQSAGQLLAREDPEAAQVVQRALERDGVRVLTGARAVKVEATAPKPGQGSGSGRVWLNDGSTIDYGQLLVALGRVPRTADIGLDAAQVRVTENGHVVVDDRLCTTNPRIWAAGDLTGHAQYTHTAGVHGSLAAGNAVLGLRRRPNPAHNPRVTFTDPEVAAIGVPTSAGERPGLAIRTVHHDHVDRAVTQGKTAGFSRLAIDARGRIVGATVVGPRAGETLGELTLAIGQGMRTREIAAATHAYPTYNDGAWNAAIEDVRARLARPGVSGATRALLRFRRSRMR